MASYDPQHFALLFAVEDRHFWFGARNHALATVIGDLTLSLPPRYRVLEIGCGTGNTLRMLERTCTGADVVVGMDLFAEGLQFARHRVSVPLVQGRIEQPPFREPFDLVGMFDVLEHMQDDAAALEQVRALTKPGGYIVITVPAYPRLWSRFDEESHHCRRYEPSDLRERLTRAGLTVDYLTPFMAALYPLARVSRWMSSQVSVLRRRLHLDQRSAVNDDLRIVPVLNEVVGHLLRKEARALKQRAQIAIGTSLLAVARVG